MLWSMGSQRVGRDLATEQQQSSLIILQPLPPCGVLGMHDRRTEVVGIEKDNYTGICTVLVETDREGNIGIIGRPL